MAGAPDLVLQYSVDKGVASPGERLTYTLRVRNASQSITGAREAARYEATVYCVTNYGSSDIKWVVGPDTPPENLRLVDDALTFQGACPS